MKRLSRSIDADRHLVLIQKYTKRIAASRLRKPFQTVRLLHPFHHGFLHDRLDIGGAEQLTFNGGRLCNPELTILGKIFLPRNIPRILKQLFKGFRMKTSHLQQDPLCRAQKYVRAADGLLISDKCHTAVFHQRDIIAQIRNFSF